MPVHQSSAPSQETPPNFNDDATVLAVTGEVTGVRVWDVLLFTVLSLISIRYFDKLTDRLFILSSYVLLFQSSCSQWRCARIAVLGTKLSFLFVCLFYFGTMRFSSRFEVTLSEEATLHWHNTTYRA
jgi:hypothetical protein